MLNPSRTLKDQFRYYLNYSCRGSNVTFDPLGIAGLLPKRNCLFCSTHGIRGIDRYGDGDGGGRGGADERFRSLSRAYPYRPPRGGEGCNGAFHIVYTSPKARRSNPILKSNKTFEKTVISIQ